MVGEASGAHNELVSPGFEIDEFECAVFIGCRDTLGLFIEAGQRELSAGDCALAGIFDNSNNAPER